LDNLVLSLLSTRDDLMLADLSGHGLTRLGLRRDQLIECGARRYSKTAEWAAAIHRDQTDIHGLMWVSRQNDRALSAVLFGDRVRSASLSVVSAGLPLSDGNGLEHVLDIAEAADITIVF
jgi:hypothetical protein